MTAYAILLLLNLLCALSLYQYLLRRQGIGAGAIRLVFSKEVFLFSTLSFLLSVAVSQFAFFYTDNSFLRCVSDACLVVWAAVVGYIDWKERVIPNALILVALLFWMLCTVFRVLTGGDAAGILTLQALGFWGIGGLLLLCSLVMKSSLGMGDVKMYAVLGLYYGIYGGFVILLVSMVVMALFAVVLLLLKKATLKTALPMAPFALLGLLYYLFFGG